MEKSKVVIVGTGFVGMSYAYALLNQGAVEELILIDINHEKAVGEAMDLNHGLAFAPRKMSISAGTYDNCKDAGLVVITAGVNQKDGETRTHLLSRNAGIIKSVVKVLKLIKTLHYIAQVNHALYWLEVTEFQSGG